MIHYDAYYYGKSGFENCQDYARAFPELNQVRLSDGCGSSSNSDIGARLLCLNGGSLLALEEIYLEGIYDIQKEDLFATFLQLGYNKKTSKTSLKVLGDGFYIEVNKEKFNCYRYYYTENAPKYLVYQSEYIIKNGLEKWKESFPNNERRIKLTCERDVVFNISSQGPEYDVELRENEAHLICSDGLESFVDKDGKKIPYNNIVKEIVDFKTLNGEFVKRRMIAFRKKCDKLGWKNLDDVSVAGISKT